MKRGAIPFIGRDKAFPSAGKSHGNNHIFVFYILTGWGVEEGSDPDTKEKVIYAYPDKKKKKEMRKLG